MIPVIYSTDYLVSLGDHVFLTSKYAGVIAYLTSAGLCDADAVIEPALARDDDIRLVHTSAYTEKLRDGTLTVQELLQLEIPWSPGVARSAWRTAGGSIRAGREALAHGLAAHVGGGLHHAFPDHGEGFCAVHDVAIAIRRLQADGAIERALVIDVDVHQGNGTAAIFAHDPHVVTFSIHQENNYPAIKPPSDVDVGLRDGATGAEYMDALRAHVPRLLDAARPDLVFYVAGADPYVDDQLGGLALTVSDLAERDRYVIGEARARGVALAITLAGGYARRAEDTIRIHARTIECAEECLRSERAVDTEAPRS